MLEGLDQNKIDEFNKYKNLLIEWNEKINLTAITDSHEIDVKHFEDSLTISKYIKEGDKVADVGTGAGFPGIPNKILNETISLCLIDSLNKRINFLNEVVKSLELTNVETIHARAEEVGKNVKYRESFDVVTARAVTKINVLAEYLIPLVKVGGLVILMKGPNYKEELAVGMKAIQLLGGEILSEEKIMIEDMERNLIIIKKVKGCPKSYPRETQTIVKKPL